METPSWLTRSQALASSGNIPMSKKVEGDAVNSRQKTGKQQDRFVLMDISNDSPIVGLAMGSLETPSSTVSKKRICGKNSGTPGSGETLLRGQVKTLLQKVEEDTEISKIPVDDVHGPFHYLKSLVNSPMGLLAPTPNNTPDVSNLSVNGSGEDNGIESAISQIVTEIFDEQKKEESDESEKDLITRSLMFDFSEKSESSCDSTSDCTSVLTYQGSKVKSSTDDASIWFMQVNASTKDDEEEDDFEGEVTSKKEEDDYDEREEEDYCDDDDAILDDLCEGLSKVSVNGVEFAGKHTRFVYNSDDELEVEEDCDAADEGFDSLASGVLRLNGLPTPKGKHVRFPMED